jgi:NADH:ubiquinone oxidoreductase subunit C
VKLDSLVEAVPSAVVDEGYGPVAVDVPVESWVLALTHARDVLGCAFFDFLSAVDEPEGLRLLCHVAALEPFGHLVLRTRLDREAPEAGSAAGVYAGAAWHERETAEMFGITFLAPDGGPLVLEGLLLPPGFEGHPLRKDFILQSRLDRPWPGAKEPTS